MEQADTLVLRTRIHPTVSALEEAGLTFTTYDGFYEKAESFEALYTAIARDLLRRAAEQGDLVYAVPGSPLVAERTVVLLRELARGNRGCGRYPSGHELCGGHVHEPRHRSD
jgi:tetrapyrrole methylase family protein/MazG family protein